MPEDYACATSLTRPSVAPSTAQAQRADLTGPRAVPTRSGRGDEARGKGQIVVGLTKLRRLGTGRGPAAVLTLFALVLMLSLLPSLAQGPLLLREAFSREFSIHVGGEQTPLVQQAFSREVSFFIGADPVPPYPQTFSREMSVVVTTPAIPDRVTQLTVSVSPTGDSAILDWSGYNELLQRDVVRYHIYVSAVPFATVSGQASPPRPLQVTGVDAAFRVITVTVSEALDKASAETGANYVFSPGNIAGASAVLSANGTEVNITAASPLTPGANTLAISGVMDLAGNTVAPGTTIGFSFQPVTYAATIQADGPLGYYRFEETSGSAAANSGTTGGHGVYYVGNETTPATGEGATLGVPHGDPGPRPPEFAGFAADNRAATFGGPTASEWIDTKNKWLHNRNAFTLEYWVAPADRPNQGDRIGIVGQNDTVEYGFINPNIIEIWTPGGGVLQTAYSFPDNEWHHVATIADGTSIRNYYDGVLVGTGGNATQNYGTTDTYNVHIGGGGITDATGNFFNGKIDEVAIFDKAIPAARILSHYRAGKEGGTLTTSGDAAPAVNGSTGPYATVAAGTFSFAISGLTPWQDHYFAVVAEDALGGSDPVVNYSAAYVLAPQAISREVSLFVGGEPAPPYAQTFSREMSVLITTPAVPERVPQLTVSVTPTGESATLDWTAYNELLQRDVVRYDIYISTHPFTSVANLNAFTSVPAGTFSVTVDNLTPWQDHYFAVVPVDGLGGSDPVINYFAAYVLAPQAITREFSLFVGGEPLPAYAQVISREVSILVPDAAVPEPVTGLNSGFDATTSVSAFSAIDLNWSSYNEVGQRDVIRYRVYAGSSFFTDVSAMQPYGYAPAGNPRHTVQGLHGGNIYYMAVVAEDALGNWNPTVRSVSAKASIGALGEVRNLAADSFTDSLRFTWTAPEEVDAFLARHHIYFNGAATPIVLPASARSYDATGLLPATGYPFRIATVDTFGTESAGVSLLAATLLDHPNNLVAESFDGMARLAWSHAEPNDLVKHYAVYASSSDFSSVAGLTPVLTTRELRADVGGLVNGTPSFFAVTTVNIVGGEKPQVQTVTATPNPVPGNFADLSVADIVSPSSSSQGQPITISWRVSNGGTGLTSSRNGVGVSSWSDRLVLSPDNVFGDADDILVANVPHAGALNVGGSYTGTATVPLPSDLLGNYFIFVMVDADDQVYEHLDSGGNLSTPQPISITVLPPSPDLTVEIVGAPPSASPGQVIEVTWKVVNQGSAPAVGSWSDAISMSSDEVLGNDFAIATVAFDYSIPPGSSVTRSAQVTVPFAAPAGAVRFVVRADSSNALTENDENNNAAIASAITDIAKVLTITLPVTQIAENAANPVIQGLVTRSGLTAAALVVTVTSSDASEAAVPATVTIPAGQASTVVPVTVQRDGIVDGSQPTTITVSADGFSPGSGVLTVLDTDVQHLALVINPATLSEGASANGTVLRDTISNQPLVVNLTSSNPSQLGVPSTVTIPANEASAPFSVIAVEDTLIESGRSFSISASASGFVGASESVTIRESDIPQVSISLDKTSVSEGAGPQAAVATITRAPVTDQPVTVALESSDTSAAVVPSTVTIPANAEFIFVPVAAVNDDLVDGPQVTSITPFAINPQTSARLFTGTLVSLTVTDDDGPTLKLVIAAQVLPEGVNAATTGTVSRNTETSDLLTVALSVDKPSETSIPATVTIPAGQSSVTFDIATLSDGITDGSQTVTITATADGFTSGSDSVVVTDENLPDLNISKLEGPASAGAEEFVSVTYRVFNQGVEKARGPFLQRIFLSQDAVIGDDILIGQYTFNGDMPTGLFFEQSLTVRLPLATGDYWLVATTDVENSVGETLESNNTTIAANPIHVQPTYLATVQAGLDSALANTPVPLSGRAFKPASNDPAPHSLVNIHILLRETERIISALTDANGNFNTTFKPLPGEAGHYEIGATHPGVKDAQVQDEFTLLGMRVNPAQPQVTVKEGESIVAQVAVENLSDVALTGLTASVVENPPNLEANVSLGGAVLPGNGTVALSYTLSALDPSLAQGKVLIRVTSAEGASVDLSIQVTIDPLRPRLEATPGSLVAGMKRGAQASVQFAIKNTGGLPTGELQLLLPDVAWLSAASGLKMPSLAPGASQVVTLLLTPPAELPLGPYRGSLMIAGNNANLQIPFEFRSLSEAKGDLKVIAVDEYTYYAEGSPKLAGAAVKVTDAITGLEAATGTTDSNGEFLATGLFESYYEIEVTAEKHSTYRGTHFVTAGQATEVQTFLSRQTVQYIWTVVPTEIEDRTKITIETVFETVVPIPVVTIEPALIDLAEITADVTQIDLKISNHGLIAANNFRLSFPTHPLWQFFPLIDNIGVLAAKTSLTVPLTIRRISPSTRSTAVHLFAASAPDLGACSLAANGCWQLVCGTLTNTYCGTVAMPNARPGCGGTIPFGGNGACCGGGGPTGGVGVTFYPPNTVTSPSPFSCDPCLLKRFLTAAKCAAKWIKIPVPDKCAHECTKGINECYKTLVGGFERKDSYKCAKGSLKCFAECSQLAEEGFKKFFFWLKVVECSCDIFTACRDIPGYKPSSIENLAATVCDFAGFTSPPKIRATGISMSAMSTELLSTPELAPLFNQARRVRAVADYYAYLLGSYNWMRIEDGGETAAEIWITSLLAAVEATSDESERISVSEQQLLSNLTLPIMVSEEDAANLVERWNRSFDFWGAGIMNLDQVPVGESTNFMAINVLRSLAAQAEQAFEESEAVGYETMDNGMREEIQNLQEYYSTQSSSDGVCARVRLRIDQEAVITRDGFKATLEILNSTESVLQNVSVDLAATDSSGQSRTAAFGIRPATLSNLSGVDGTGLLNRNTTGTATWVLVPSSDAAPNGSMQYFVSGTLRYLQDGVAITVPLAAAPIMVHPNANLLIDYFHQRDVFSDDPFTDEIEPSVPFSLAVMVNNTGNGEARNMRITSAQPQIIENEKGLLIDFKIIATEIAGENLTPSLTANFGNVPPGDIEIGRWLLTSTLQGLFIDYKATFEHLDGLGNPKLSLIENVAIHEMIHLVQAQGVFEDGKPDFLVNEIPDLKDYPDTLYLSDGTMEFVSVVTEGSASGPPTIDQPVASLSAVLPPGWVYLRVPEPSDGRMRLTRLVRSDGVEIAFDKNVWTTDRTFIGMGKRPIRENILHLLDYNSTGSYTLHYNVPPPPDTEAPQSAVAALANNSAPQIPVQWAGQDTGRGIAFFDVFVSADGGAFTPWLQKSTSTGALYDGVAGHQYAFYSVATDLAGNRENAPATPDAQTLVSLFNSAPTLAAVADHVITEGETASLTLTATDPDGAANTLTYTLEPGAPAGVQLNPSTGQLTWTTGEAHGGQNYSISARVTDNGTPALSDSKTFKVTVTEVNTPPTLTPIANQTVNQGAALSFTGNASDGDLPGQTLVFTLDAGAPAGASINPGTGLFSWTPPANHPPGPAAMTVRVTDNGVPSQSASQTFQVLVQRANHAPIAQNDSMGTTRGKPASVLLAKLLSNDEDPDRDPLTFSLTQGTSTQGGTLALGAGMLTYTPLLTFQGTDSIGYQIEDGLGGTAVATVMVTVSAGNEAGYSTISIARLDNGVVRLRLVGIPGFTYTIQASPDLTAWSAIGSVTVGENGEVDFDDTRPANADTQFYRLVYP